MKLVTRVFILTVCAGWLTFGQSPKAEPKPAAAEPKSEPAPKFEAADVHASAKTQNPFMRTTPVRDRRYQVKNATMVDLVRIAYGFDTDKILGGPNWLELDRFDVFGKVPPESTPETHKLMVRSLLEERFKLAVHKDTQPLPTYVLTVGKKSQLKEASGSEETGCRPKAASGAPAEGGIRLMMSNENGAATTINLGPGMTVQYNCRNISMEAFAANLRTMIGASLGPNAVMDETGLKGNWNFDLTYSMGLIGPMGGDTGEHISIVAAVEKQLGLKLEERQIPTPVLVVDSVNRSAGENPASVAEALPPIPIPTEFEVASIKPSDPATRMSRFQLQAGGRLTVERMPLTFLIQRAFEVNNNDQIVGMPTSMEMYDIAAKLPAGGAVLGPNDTDMLSKALLALLVDRFKLTYHKEERQVSAYSLVAGKPRMKKADPASRIFCKNTNAPPGAPPGTRMMKCQNVTMAPFAERLQNMTPDFQLPVLDATGLEGTWDFTLTFNLRASFAMGGGRMGGDAGQSAAGIPSASDPTGGYTLAEALEKQLGLKLEKQKRPVSVVVIDHIEPKPADN